jgi:predicted CXXCH cytochrome family protein
MRWLAVPLLALPLAAAAASGSVLGSKHDLSARGPGDSHALSEPRSCIFCHATHRSRRPRADRPVQGYESTTMASPRAGGVSGASRVCLGCHDGVIALGETMAGRVAMTGPARLGGRVSLGTDLSGTHPVSIRPARVARLRDPPAGDDVRLDRSGLVQCTACHDPHSEANDPIERKFLVKPSGRGAICLSCHVLPPWTGSSHRTSTAALRAGIAGAPRSTTVAERACASCHASHGAGPRLLRASRRGGDDGLCLECHDGSAARLDVASQVAKPWAHAMTAGSPSVHDASEGPDQPAHTLPERRAGAPRHVACVDCHDPHAATAILGTGPRASGPLSGVWGIDRNGLRVQPVGYEYEVCLKCHGDSANQPQALPGPGEPRRAAADANLRRVFDPSSPSFHPVFAPSRSGGAPGLLAGIGPTIRCSDCHASDASGAGAPRGPHGSVYPHLLERGYATADGTPESPIAYSLCYKCHDRTTLFAIGPAPHSRFYRQGAPGLDASLHLVHVVRSAAPCSVCHDAHGVSSRAGTAQANAHLVDFDLNVVRPNASGLLRYRAVAPGTGSCALSCHGRAHDDSMGY